MTDLYFQELRNALQLGISEKGHPFRYGTLATVGTDQMPRQRTIVLREVSDSLHLGFYTDQRSKKVTHIQHNNKVSLLFYHPEKLLQVKIEGMAMIQKDKAVLQDHWNKTTEGSRKDYTTKVAPGSTVSNPDSVDYLNEAHHFCMVTILPYQIEYLKLKRPNHLRVQYVLDGNGWKGQFLVP